MFHPPMIPGVLITPLKQIPDERGKVMHMLKCTDAHFGGFGEVYFSVVRPRAVKAWKRHREMTLNLACVQGAVRLVVFDDRADSPMNGRWQEILLSPQRAEQYVLVTVPPMLWTGFVGAQDGDSLLCNCATLPHDPKESDRREPGDPAFPNIWGGPAIPA